MKTQHFIYIIIAFIILAACEEPIDIPLRQADQRLVIEGLITDSEGPHDVQLTWLNQFGDTAAAEPAVDAVVTITDAEAGFTETLVMNEPGLYQTNQIIGKEGNTYTLSVSINGEEYGATSKLPPVGRLDSVLYRYVDDLTAVPEAGYYLRFYAQDDGSSKDFYLTQLLQNDTLYTDGALPYLIFDDRFAQGAYIPGFLVPFPLDSGNVAKLAFYTMTEEAYDYYFAIVQQNGSGSPFGAPPANLPTNLSNGALGFFRASGYRYLEGKLNGYEGVFK
ncbi:MAG: DUF4249 domain-containing protein [Bacteroidia bacterium]